MHRLAVQILLFAYKFGTFRGFWIQKVVSILYVGGAVGALIGGSLCDRFGRKRTIILTDIVFIVGALVL